MGLLIHSGQPRGAAPTVICQLRLRILSDTSRNAQGRPFSPVTDVLSPPGRTRLPLSGARLDEIPQATGNSFGNAALEFSLAEQFLMLRENHKCTLDQR